MNLFPRDSLFDFWPLMDRRRSQDEEHHAVSMGMPRIDIVEEEDKYLLSADLPGVNKEDLSITLTNGVLRIEARRSEESETQEKHFIRKERHEGVFVRNIEVGDSLKADQIDAHFDNGVLKLVLPKVEPKAPVRDQVEIH
ncbi:Hsp20/alpha crystallin family protein [Ferrimonas sediminicola]|uniref:Hsp20/alpha crystallin family protein n=1 Tax=Ferrimonas sediminicola TaxID=2569538 RepID=A0A4U1BK49_9GAMM|nr:Hsp20/alpha crystallin family protein [Ferrimonas sediminicola]TKB50470.1 Hsp20/alpha crystallin family protein [Ferrimonas sediminicola]